MHQTIDERGLALARNNVWCRWAIRLAAMLALPLMLDACALGPDGTPCYITSSFECQEMAYQRGNDGADPNYIDPSGAWEGTLGGTYIVLNLSALGGRMNDGGTEYFHDGGNVWQSYDGYATIRIDSPDRAYLWDDASGVEGTLYRLTYG